MSVGFCKRLSQKPVITRLTRNLKNLALIIMRLANAELRLRVVARNDSTFFHLLGQPQ
jgi:hypothetical protein